MRRTIRHIVYLKQIVTHCINRCSSICRRGVRENIHYFVKQVPHVGMHMHDGVLPESVVHKFSH